MKDTYILLLTIAAVNFLLFVALAQKIDRLPKKYYLVSSPIQSKDTCYVPKYCINFLNLDIMGKCIIENVRCDQ
jgi:hypothetical protein